MKRLLQIYASLLALLCLTCATQAQTGIPAAPGAVPAAAPAQPATLWSFLGLTPENCERCRKKLCSKPIGQLLNSMLTPLSFATGGLMHPLCPPGPDADDLKKLMDPNSNASPAEQAAAAIKANVAGMKDRIAAVRYLGTVDCHFFPDAEPALIAALRGDPLECVRLEAALALGRGCCCTKKTLAALTIAATGGNSDKNPAETSPRVRAAAMRSLNCCLNQIGLPMPDAPVRPEFPPGDGTPPPPVRPEQPAVAQSDEQGDSKFQLTSYYEKQLRYQSHQDLVRKAGLAVAETVGTQPSMTSIPGGQRGLLQIWQRAQTPQRAEEIISFEEAAIQIPDRQVGEPPVANRDIQQVHDTNRASLGFEPAKLLPQFSIPMPKIKTLAQQPTNAEEQRTSPSAGGLLPQLLNSRIFPTKRITNETADDKNNDNRPLVEPVPFPVGNAPPPESALPASSAMVIPVRLQVATQTGAKEEPLPPPGPPATDPESTLPRSRTEQPNMRDFARTTRPINLQGSSGMIQPYSTPRR